MKYTTRQIETAKRNYNNFLRMETVTSEMIETMGTIEANSRVDFHNNIISEIRNGNKELEREWKLFFLTEEVKKDQKNDERKDKLNANKAASADILEPIKSLRKLGEFGKWLNTKENPFRKQHFNKKYTQEAVESFLKTL